ncbi:MAG: hypothetical protein AAFW75_16080 [Cyanobacteria bacterium J06636_16]
MTTSKGESRFASLRQLRAERQTEPAESIEAPEESTDAAEPVNQASIQVEAVQKSEPRATVSALPEPMQAATVLDASPPRRGPGRPPGRRSDPDYTQISAYIPLDLLLAVQDELAAERREKRQRTARPVSDLVEELLSQWLTARKNQNSEAVNL